ncbi:MAG: hypothetical protein SF052_14785 [Bacteroidia bacterium]|nr:hypothetical protein [Bacteroidia bacterium]
MSRNLRIMLMIVAVSAFIGASAGIYMFNKPHEDVSSAQADYSLSVDELFIAFSNDETASNEKFLNKIVEVKGVIGEKSDSPEGVTLILNAKGEMFGVSCGFVGEDAAPLKDISVGSEVTVRGICTGFLTDVNLARCVLM